MPPLLPSWKPRFLPEHNEAAREKRKNRKGSRRNIYTRAWRNIPGTRGQRKENGKGRSAERREERGRDWAACPDGVGNHYFGPRVLRVRPLRNEYARTYQRRIFTGGLVRAPTSTTSFKRWSRAEPRGAARSAPLRSGCFRRCVRRREFRCFDPRRINERFASQVAISQVLAILLAAWESISRTLGTLRKIVEKKKINSSRLRVNNSAINFDN